MPTYEYECQKCQHHFDLFQRMTEPPIKRCPKCKGKVKRLVGTGAGIIFKGGGFYQTDYRSENYKKGAKTESSAPPSKPADGAAKSTPAADGAAKSTPAADSGAKIKRAD